MTWGGFWGFSSSDVGNNASGCRVYAFALPGENLEAICDSPKMEYDEVDAETVEMV